MTTLNGRHEENHVDLDLMFKTLSGRPRRRVLTPLMSDDHRWQDEFETVEFRSDGEERDSIALELHHSHLPQVDEVGVIDWDQTTGQIPRGENFEEIQPLLELIDDHQEELHDDWP